MGARASARVLRLDLLLVLRALALAARVARRDLSRDPRAVLVAVAVVLDPPAIVLARVAVAVHPPRRVHAGHHKVGHVLLHIGLLRGHADEGRAEDEERAGHDHDLRRDGGRGAFVGENGRRTRPRAEKPLSPPGGLPMYPRARAVPRGPSGIFSGGSGGTLPGGTSGNVHSRTIRRGTFLSCVRNRKKRPIGPVHIHEIGRRGEGTLPNGYIRTPICTRRAAQIFEDLLLLKARKQAPGSRPGPLGGQTAANLPFTLG